MKALFTHLFVFCFLAIGLSGCSGSASSGPVNGPQTASNAPKTGDAPKNNSAYPLFVEKIPNGDIELLDGTITKVADRKGKVILLNLWATWCGPCRGEMPHLVEMQNAYRDKGFEVLGLDIGDGEGQPETTEEIKAFAEQMKLNYELGRISNATTNEFNRFTKFNAVPQSILVDREGRIRGVFLGGGIKVITTMKASVEKVVNE